MVANNQLAQQQMHALFSEIHYLIRLLYVTHDVYMKNLTLNQLWNKIEQLQFLIRITEPYSQPQPAMQPVQVSPQLPSAPIPTLPSTQLSQQQSQNLQSFTREQLAQFNGTNGRPAYVAVKGIVYDVTNNAAWSAATHFGLTAGKDLTQEFASCHAAEQWILNTLSPVGRLMS